MELYLTVMFTLISLHVTHHQINGIVWEKDRLCPKTKQTSTGATLHRGSCFFKVFSLKNNSEIESKLYGCETDTKNIDTAPWSWGELQIQTIIHCGFITASNPFTIIIWYIVIKIEVIDIWITFHSPAVLNKMSF